MKKVLYVCKCGCINTQEEMIHTRQKVNGKDQNRNRCIKHQATSLGNIASRIAACDNCHCEIKLTNRGGVPALCKECNRPVLLKAMRDRARKKNHSRPKNKALRNGHLANPDRWDCAHRVKCLKKYDGYETIPCLHCHDYRPEALKIDALAGVYRHGTVRHNPVRSLR